MTTAADIPARAGLWRHGDFLRLWAAQAVSDFGARITREGLPLAAVLTIHARPAQLGVLAALSIAPQLIVGLTAGGLVDRSRRRGLMIASDMVRATVVATVPLAAWMGWLTIAQLYAAALVVGAASVLFDIADHAYLPSLIGKAQLIDGNAKLSITESAAEIGGPAVPGMLVQALTAPIAMAVNAVTYLASGLVLMTIGHREAPVEPTPGRRPKTLARLTDDLKVGFGAIISHPLVRPLWLMNVGATLFGSIFSPLYLYFALKTLNLTPTLLGLAIAAGGVGAMLGAAMGPAIARRLGVGPTILWASILGGVSALAIPFAPASPVGAMTVMVLTQVSGDALGVITIVQASSLRQIVLPNAVLGRVGAAFRVGPGAVAIVGALAGGVLAEVIGVRPAMMIAAGGIILCSLAGLFSPLPGLKEMPLDEDGPA
jgi:MFS family permease